MFLITQRDQTDKKKETEKFIIILGDLTQFSNWQMQTKIDVYKIIWTKNQKNI